MRNYYDFMEIKFYIRNTFMEIGSKILLVLIYNSNEKKCIQASG